MPHLLSLINLCLRASQLEAAASYDEADVRPAASYDEADVRPAASYDEADVRFGLESGDLSLFTFAGVHELIGEPCGEEFHISVTP